MRKIILILAVAATFITACNNNTVTNETTKSTETMSVDTTKMKTGDVYYQCEMHPEVVSVKADSCAKCGMDLEKVIKK